MSESAASDTVPSDTPATADLRATAHGAGTAACIALLLLAAELALDTLPTGVWRDQASSALTLASRIPAGESVDPGKIIQAMQSEKDEGPLVYMQLVPPGPQAQAWNAVAEALGYAAWHECLRRGQHPNSLIEGYASSDSLDFSIDPYVGVPSMNWEALDRVTAWVRQYASKADEGWGRPLRVEDLRRVAREMIAAA